MAGSRRVGVYEAKTNLTRLVDEVSAGEVVTITRHGVDVAVMSPPETQRRARPGEIAREIREMRKGKTLEGVSIAELIEAGRA